PPAVVISNKNLPDMDGYEFCRQIKANQNLKNIQVILLTSLHECKDIFRCLELGVDNFIMKPYDKNYLLSCIHTIVENRARRFGKSKTKQTADQLIFQGQKYFISATREQIFGFLFTTCEAAVRTNRALCKAQHHLQSLNEQVEKKVEERITALKAEITERAQEELRKLSSAVKQTADTVMITDKDGAIEYVNPAFVELTGYTKEEVIGQTPRILKSQKHNEKFYKELWETILAGQVMRTEFINRKKSGELYYQEATITPIVDSAENITHFVATGRNITERKRAEKKMKRIAVELVRSNIELEQFASIASHDLQEPLRMVSSYLQLLQRRYQGKLDADADDFIAFAVDGANRMKALIHDLLLYSRVGTQGKPFKPTDCEAVFDQTVANLKLVIADNGALVKHDALPTVMADEVQLLQLFQNLIGNAIKFRKEESPQVHVAARQKGSKWVFSFRDNGIGIKPEYANRIFIIFQRLHNRNKYSGTGIGLAVCKKIVERHGGRIWVESQPGVGSTFSFTLPVYKEVRYHGSAVKRATS
ncbi:MAG: ATP-binding protein, partial [bacterium]